MEEINPIAWFGDRELDFVPRHFHRSTTPMNLQNLVWVRNKLTGRYSVSAKLSSQIPNSPDDLNSYIFFEDQKELVIFELRWAGK